MSHFQNNRADKQAKKKKKKNFKTIRQNISQIIS